MSRSQVGTSEIGDRASDQGCRCSNSADRSIVVQRSSWIKQFAGGMALTRRLQYKSILSNVTTTCAHARRAGDHIATGLDT